MRQLAWGRSEAMKWFMMAVLVLGLIAALSIGLTSQGSPGSKPPFMGAWESIDNYDGSDQVMAIGGGAGRHHVTLYDDRATLACKETEGPATAIGFGSVDGDELDVVGLVRCPSEQETYEWYTTFTYHPSDDTLTDPVGSTWYRIGR